MKLQNFLNQYLYHATYKQLLPSIKKHGLNPNHSSSNWEDSKPGYVYLAKDKNVAISYAETNDKVDEEWLDEIVVLKVNVHNLEKHNLSSDENVIDNEGDTLQYKGVIPFKYLTIEDD